MASATHELSDTIDKDFQHAEKLSVPITFVILLIAFGAFVAAGVPVLLAFSAVLGSVGLAALASHVFHASDATQSVILLMGMAVGVDYSLFYLKREREERARRPRAGRGALPRCGDLRAGGADLGRDGDDRDGRDAACRHQDLQLDRDRRDGRRLHRRWSAR